MSDADSKALGVGLIPSGLFIVCTKDKESVTQGFLASWAQQVSFDPLRVTICLKPGRSGFDEIMQGDTFSLNVVGEKSNQYMRYFWRGYAPEENPFTLGHIETSENEFGGVVMSEALGTITLKKAMDVEAGDHRLVIADVLHSSKKEVDEKPMVHIRKSGLDY